MIKRISRIIEATGEEISVAGVEAIGANRVPAKVNPGAARTDQPATVGAVE